MFILVQLDLMRKNCLIGTVLRDVLLGLGGKTSKELAFILHCTARQSITASITQIILKQCVSWFALMLIVLIVPKITGAKIRPDYACLTA